MRGASAGLGRPSFAARAPGWARTVSAAAASGRTGDRLRAAARDLFYEHGIRAVSVDTVAARAGVTKVTLYQHYRSKNQLLADALREHSKLRHGSLQDYIDGLGGPAAERLLGVFRWYEELPAQENFRGCPLINAEVEVGHTNPEVREIVAAHKRTIRELLARLVRDAELPDPDTVAGQLQLLAEGAISMALVEGSAEPTRRARTAAASLLGTTRAP